MLMAVGVDRLGDCPMTETLPDVEYYHRLLDFDWPGAVAVVHRYLAEGGDGEGVDVDVLTPALIRTGHEWERGRISVAHEHYISEVTRDLVRQHGPRVGAETPERTPVVVACCAPRERHGIGLMMVSDALRSGGM